MIEKSHFLSKKIEELEQKLELLKSVESEEEYFKKMSKKQIAYRKTQLKENKKKSMDTIALWGLYGKRDMDQYKSYIPPIYAATAGAPLKSLEYGKLLLAYEIFDDPNKMYSRIDNITVDHLAHKVASMEGKGIPELTHGLCTSSGMSAIFMATMPFLEVGDTFVAPKLMFGGTFHLFETTYPKMGWKARWVEEPEEPENWRELIDENTKFLYAEFPTNPTLFCPDLSTLSDLAHEFDIPLIVDSTLATPILTRPLEHGADVVVHSATKMMCGSGRAVGGVLVSKEVITTEKKAFKKHFARKVKEGPFRNLGPCMSPYEAKEIWDALNTLKFRVQAASQKAMKVANFLQNHPTIERVNYPGLPS
ncbi:MAG: hypothetical protein GWO20_05915, partial [Candidatus Korarchaeota archaeon]|nr:hypothetical protein [Candidatus Korarchaeota archaeon]NIU82981.1 hypothetical protein [Candidatus Thorarchaeota archaeon]NIW13413.1 hypothetical protein [Candidatus Thorarchaeota archaeon]NIW51514.1 hypothetical protein [Candidatus Korarchaeota archaeon]